jgi:hypothetical protein
LQLLERTDTELGEDTQRGSGTFVKWAPRFKVSGRLATVNFIPLETVSRGEMSERDGFDRTVPKKRIVIIIRLSPGRVEGCRISDMCRSGRGRSVAQPPRAAASQE